MAAVDNNANTINANAAGDALSVVRDRLFHTLFYKITLLYHRNVPRRWRRIIETMMLSKVRGELMFISDVMTVRSFRGPNRISDISMESSAREGSVTDPI